jgi:hypothetical protein
MLKKSLLGLILVVGLLVVGTSAFAHGADNPRGTGYGPGYGYGHMGYGPGYGHMWVTDDNTVVQRPRFSGKGSVQYQRPGYGHGRGWHRGWGGYGGCWR